MDDRLDPGPVALFGSPQRWALLQQAIAEGRTWYYGDHGYFGRQRYFRVTRDAYQYQGNGEGSVARWDAFRRPIQPWRQTGGHVLVCPNSAIHFSLFGLDVEAWLRAVEVEIGRATDRPVRIRWKAQSRTSPIDADLQDCWAVVTYSSAAAIDALIAGVPVFVLAPFAASARMGLSDLQQIETPFYPDDRESFCQVLAAHQWTLDEIARGMAWASLRDPA